MCGLRVPLAGALLLVVLGPLADAVAMGWRPVAVPAGGDDIVVSAVSCPVRSDCVAIGGDSSRAAVGAHWDGRHWSFQRIASPPGAAGVGLGSVSCSRRGSCVAVGSMTVEGGTERAFAVHLSRGRWAVLPGTGTGTPLQAVSCAPHGTCVAVGWRETFRWNGRHWVRHALPRRLFPEQVSCWARDRCLAVAEDLKRGGWRSIEVPRSAAPATRVLPGTAFQLAGLSCVSRRFCDVVGRDRRLEPLAGAWDGRRWVRQAMPGFAGFDSVLSGVSCWAASRCAAVGFDAHDRTLAGAWDGRQWRRERTALGGAPRFGWGELFGVSCRPGGVCTAVGSGRRPGVLVERRR